MHLQRSKTYYRYLLSYVAPLVVTIVALAMFSQAYFVVQLRTSLEEGYRSNMRQTSQQLDSNLQQIYTMDYQISCADENFFSYYLEPPSPLRDLRIVNEFKNLLAPSTFIEEVALIASGEDSVYTSTAVYAKSLFFGNIFSFDNWEDPLSDINQLTGRLVRPAERVNGSSRYITFINTPSVFSRLQKAVQIYFVREEYFLWALSKNDQMDQQGLISDSMGNLIVSTLPLDGPVSGNQVAIGGVKYLVMQEQSSVLDWTYTFLLPTSQALAPIVRAQVTINVFLLVMIVLGVLLIHYAMQVSYKPIKELTQTLGAPADGDEVGSLRDVILSLSEQNEHMRSQLMCSPDGQALKDALLFSLLKGKFASFERFNQEARPLNMVFDKPWYQVLMLRHFGQDEELRREVLEGALNEALGDGYVCYFRELFEPSMIVCLVGMEQDDQTEIARRCGTLLDVCLQDHALSFTIGLSQSYQDIAHITTACFEATQAVREYFIKGRHQVIRYREQTKPPAHQDNLLTMLDDIATQTPQQQEQTVRRFIDTLKEHQVPSLLARSYCNSAVQLLMGFASRAVNMEDPFTISYLRTADDYLAFMLKLVQREPTPLPQESAPKEDISDLLRRIYAYLAEHYDDCNFSIQEAADHLELSSSYMSQYFKQQTGDTLTGYVGTLRIRKACNLLETTTMPLQMIYESVGYYNLNSFIRRFKQITGITPGEYRRNHQ